MAVRSFFRYSLLALVLVTVFLASALTAMRFAIHGREVAVPKFIGMRPADAERMAANNGLLLLVENRFYSADIPAGRVVTQQPQPGEKVRRGWQVRVAESLGPQRVTIPNVVGQSSRAAELDLTRRGLQVGATAQIHLPGTTSAPDTIVAQSPTAGATGITTPTVNLLIAAPESPQPALVMPGLLGRTLDEAAREIAAAGLKFGNVSSRDKSVGRISQVVHQSPAAGQKVYAGATVDLQVVRQ